MKKEIGLRNREKLNDFLCGFFSNDGFGLKSNFISKKTKPVGKFLSLKIWRKKGWQNWQVRE